MAMNEVQRLAFNERADRAIDQAQDALRPLFDTVAGGGVYHLAEPEAELLHEIMFKLGMARSVIVQRDVAVQDVHGHWLEAQARQRRARTKRE